MKTLIAVLLVIFAAVFFVTMNSPQLTPVAAKAKTPQEKQQDDKYAADQERALLGAQILRKAMRNPDSFKLVSVFVTTKDVVCYEYRAQNGFGGMNVEYAVLAPPYRGFNQNASAWNSRCFRGQTRNDETWAVTTRMGGK